MLTFFQSGWTDLDFLSEVHVTSDFWSFHILSNIWYCQSSLILVVSVDM